MFRNKNQRWLDRRKNIPNFKYYGFFNNILYAFGRLRQYNYALMFMIIISGIAVILTTLSGIYLPKLIIDFIEYHYSVVWLIIFIISLGLIQTISGLANSKIQNNFEWQYKRVLIYLNQERMIKSLNTDFLNFENVLFLDISKRAERATKHGFGFYEIYRNSCSLLSQSILVIIAASSIFLLNPIVLLVLGILSYGAYKILNITMAEDKVKHNDVLAPIQRKIRYIDQVTRDNDYAKDIRFYSMSFWLEKKLLSFNKEYVSTYRKHHNRWIRSDALVNSVIWVQSLIIYAWLLYMVLFEGMTTGNFVLYIGLVNTFSKSLIDFFWTVASINKNSMDVNDYRSFLEWPEIDDKKEDECGHVTVVDFEAYEFRFEHVYFKYPEQEDYVIKDLNFVLKSGMKLAIVGANGVGKTTLIKLLLRLYEPTDGRILLNGVDINTFERKSYFKIFSPIFQDIEYFAMPLWANISLVKDDKTNRELVVESINKSGLGQKNNKLKYGIDTPMRKIFSKEGIDLSGGEKQRMAMTRALYKNAPVIVLDEPTAALDALAEDRMYREFNQLICGKTTIFISHRLSSTRFCDEIILVDDGHIVERGTHDELLERNGKYARMYDVQAQYYRVEDGSYGFE